MIQQVCPECDAPYKVGALFCDECGRNLLSSTPLDSREDRDLHIESEKTDSHLSESGEIDREIEFVILNSGRRVTLPLAHEIRIGRSDPSRDTRPILDVSSDDGAILGVSRIHASLQSTKNGVILVDLGSKNGTFLHEESLEVENPSQLKSGDIFRLGEMKVQVFFEN